MCSFLLDGTEYKRRYITKRQLKSLKLVLVPHMSFESVSASKIKFSDFLNYLKNEEIPFSVLP